MFRTSQTNIASYKRKATATSPMPLFQGPVISNFSPSDVTGLEMWYKADVLAYNNGDSVTAWADSSGNGRNLTNSGTAPKFTTNYSNGKPTVTFNGSNALICNLTSTFSSGMTVFGVGDMNGSTGNDGVICMNTTGNDYDPGDSFLWCTGYNGGAACGFFISWRSVGGANITDAGFTTKSVWRITVQDTGGGNINKLVYRNDVEKQNTTGAASSTLQPTHFVMGARLVPNVSAPQLVGNLSEIIIYNTYISLANQVSVVNYLKSKYSL